MGVYRPTIDLPGTGRITLVRERMVDLTARGKPDSLDPASRPADARAAVLLHQAVMDAADRELSDTLDLPEVSFLYPTCQRSVLEPTFPLDAWHSVRAEIDGHVAYPAWMLSRPMGRAWDGHPVDGSAPPPENDEVVEGSIRGGWIARDGLWTPMIQAPIRVVARLDATRDLAARNPAFAALRRHDLIPRETGYRAWLDTVALPTGDGWVARDPENPATPGGQFRHALSEYARADLDPRGQSDRLESLLGDLIAACEAVGMTLPADSRDAHDVLVGLLASPWKPVTVAGVPPIRVIGLSGHGSPGSLRFTSGYAEVDLADRDPDPSVLRGEYASV